MSNFFKSYVFKFWLFAFIVFLTRLPFLSQGYGLNEDSWKLASTARDIAASGQMEVSRFPGYPVQELVCSLFYNGYAFRLNLLTAILSTVGFLFFAMALKVWKFKHIFLAATALAFVRIVYVNSTTTIDYLWALSFLLISLYYVARQKPLSAGIFLGIAVGCRITSSAMALPYCIMILQTDGLQKNLVRIFKFTFASVMVAVLLYLPVYVRYGWKFLAYYDVVYPSVIKVLERFFTNTWGIVGLIALMAATIILFIPPKTKARYLFPRSINEKYVISWLIAIDIYIILFLRFPVESGYLIPIVPFTILIFGKYLYDGAFKFFSIALIISPFIISVSPLDRDNPAIPSPASFKTSVAGEQLRFDLKGSIFAYESRRKNGLAFTENIISSLDTLKTKSLIIAGSWYNQIALEKIEAHKDTEAADKNLFGLNRQSSPSVTPVELRNYITQDSLLYFIGKGYNVYYLPKQDLNNLLMRKVDINLYGAEPYITK